MSCILLQNWKLKAYLRPLPFLSVRKAPSIHRLSSPCNWFTSWLSYGKQWSYPDYRHFLPPPFTAMPGMAAVFTQAWSGKLQIPHPHGICIMGYKGQGFLGEKFILIQTHQKKRFSSARDMMQLDNLVKLVGISKMNLWVLLWDPWQDQRLDLLY